MNKYSMKIINFINKLYNLNITDLNDFKLEKNININHPLIKKIKDIMHKIISSFIKFNKEKFYLGKLDSEDFPKIYLFFREYLKSTDEIITINSYIDFAKWFNTNQHKIDYDQIYTNIKSSENLLKLFNESFQIGKPREKLHDILHKNNFVGIDTIHLSEMLDLEEYVIENEHSTIRLYFEKNQDVEEIILRIMNIVTIMHEINKSIIKTNVDKLNLNIFLGKQRKEITSNNILTPININSGSCLRGVFVNIWREEELEKVLFHELQHFYSCDFHTFNKNYDKIHSFVREQFDIIGDDKSNESINEMMAILLHSIYQSERLHMEIDMIYSYEIFFSLFQIAKIIRFFNGNSYDELFKSNKKHIKIKQTTSVVSYYIIKGILLFNINSTMDFIEKVNLKVDDNKILLYKEYLEQILNKKEDIREIVNKFIEIYKELEPNKFISKTLRMSALS
jgi:hypothetical protein